jgi:hypothetical protein
MVIANFNTLEELPDVPATWVEDELANIESFAATVIASIIDGAEAISPDDRITLACFLFLQHQRTPLGREWVRFMMRQIGKFEAMQHVMDADHVTKFFENRGEHKTNDEIIAFQQDTIRQLEEGVLIVDRGHDGEVLGMFLGADMIAPIIAQEMSWYGMLAPEQTEFIISDHPLVFYDPAAHRDQPAAWRSSDTVQVTLPLSPRICLFLTPGPPLYERWSLEAADVDEINLRTYAWGHWAIYGSSHAAVQKTRAVAKKHKAKVLDYAPRAPGMTIFETFERASAPFNVITERAASRGTRKRSKRKGW